MDYQYILVQKKFKFKKNGMKIQCGREGTRVSAFRAAEVGQRQKVVGLFVYYKHVCTKGELNLLVTS